MNEFALRWTMMSLTQQTVDVCLTLLAAFFGIALIWNVFNSMMKTGRLTSLGTIFGLFVSAILLVLYIPIVNMAMLFTQGMADLFPSPDIGVLWSNTWSDWMAAGWSFVKGENFNIFQKIVAGNGTYLIRKIIEYLQLLTIAILVVVGPLALLMDLIPVFKGTAIKWFLGLITVGMWSVTFGILDQFFYGYLNLYSLATPHFYLFNVGGPFADSGMIFHTLISCVFMLLYFLVPFITALWIGRSDAASLGGKMFSIGALGAAIAIKGATMGAGAMATAPAAVAQKAAASLSHSASMGSRPDLSQSHHPNSYGRNGNNNQPQRSLPEGI